jgi:hypothetical protein
MYTAYIDATSLRANPKSLLKGKRKIAYVSPIPLPIAAIIKQKNIMPIPIETDLEMLAITIVSSSEWRLAV